MKYAVSAYFINRIIIKTEEDFGMENEVMEKMVLFLQNLRCENVNRETLVHLDSCEREKTKLRKLQTEYEKVKARMFPYNKECLEKYQEQAERAAFEEQQEAYLQGMVDAFQVLEGLGVIRASEKIENLIKRIENDSFNS